MTQNDTHIQELKTAVRSRRSVLVLGAGVTAASSSSVTASSWINLIESGVDYYLQHIDNASDRLAQSIRDDLELASLGHAITSAADKLTDALGGVKSAGFAKWLREAVGEADLTDRRLIEAIESLEAPIATVNYDTLVERVTGRTPRTWREPAELQAALNNQTKDIGHLHGCWTDPESVIFGARSYGRLSGDSPTQSLQQALGALRSLIFIGCGAGLADPNFEGLRTWLTATYPESRIQHFRLCLTGELDDLREFHKDDNVTPVAFGTDYADLAPFLEEIQRSADSSGASAPERAIALLEEQLRSESIFAQHMPDLEMRTLDQIVVPPVILPITPEQFAAANREENGLRISRSNVVDDLRHRRPIILVGDESSGLTTALQWLIYQAVHVQQSAVAIPILVDYRNLKPSAKPLDKLLRKSLREAGAGLGNSAPLPLLALAIDNVVPAENQTFKLLVSELIDVKTDALFIACHTGSEVGLQRALSESGMRPIVRYLGRLNSRDIQEFASLVAPHQAQALAGKAVEIIQREHLARTPLTVCLLVSVLMTGEALLSTASATSLLDAYVQLLLGRGTATDDARFALDSHELSSLLARLAHQFVELNTGALEESAVIACFEDYFETKGWSESAADALALLKGRHVLVRRGGKVQFAQSSFLHLFAAKRAIRNLTLREYLLARPHRFSEIIKHYAALTRDDATLVAAIGLFVQAEAAEIDGMNWPRGETLSDKPIKPDADAGQLALLLEHLDDPILQDHEEGAVSRKEDTADPLDEVHDEDAVAFPVNDITEGPPLVRVIETLGLVSAVLRDSEEVEDLPLKQAVLGAVLALWGRLVDALEVNNEFKDFVAQLVDGLAIDMDVPEADLDDFKARFNELAPLLTAASGMYLTLSSRKLSLMLERVLADPSITQDAGVVIMGCLLGVNLGQPGWSEYFLIADSVQADVKAVQEVLLPFALHTYYNETVENRDGANLLDFASLRLGLKYGRRNSTEQRTASSKIKQRMIRNRLAIAQKPAPRQELK